MKRKLCILLIAAFLLLLPCGCTASKGSDVISLTFWHVYGDDPDASMNALVDQFNRTVGAENGIVVNVTSVSSIGAAHDALIAAAQGDPGAGDLPDLCVCLPETVEAVGTGRFADWNQLLSADCRASFTEEFLTCGVFGGEQLLLPLGVSTDVLYVNTTAFDRFAAETGATYSDLSTWEGLFSLANAYAARSGADGSGRAFLKQSLMMNYLLTGTEELGGSLFSGSSLRLDTPALKQCFCSYASCVFSGGIYVGKTRAPAAFATGQVIAEISEGRELARFQSRVIYPDNTTEQIGLDILPVPVFSGTRRTALLSGSGLCVLKSTPEKEKAAAVFCQWLAQPENDLSLAAQNGMVPATIPLDTLSGMREEYCQGDESRGKLLDAMLATLRGSQIRYTSDFENFIAARNALSADVHDVFLEDLPQSGTSSPQALSEDAYRQLCAAAGQ